MDIELYYTKLAVPLARMVTSICIGLFVASLVESLGWTRFVARLAAPLARSGHLREVSSASFALAFFSPAAANSLLAEAHGRGEISRAELVLANVCNSSPSYLVHLPSLFILVYAFLGPLAFVYAGLTFAASVLRTACTLLVGRLLLPAPAVEGESREAAAPENGNKREWREIANVTLRRFKRRVTKLLLFTVPIYILFFAMQRAGMFSAAELWLAGHAGWLGFLNPKSLGIVVLHLAAEQGAALAAAASLADTGALAGKEIVMALLVGNIVASPMRAARHQFPSYAGYFAPAMALRLVIANQTCRALSLACVAAVYYFCAF